MASEIALKIAPVFDGTEDNEKDHVTSASEEEDSESESKHENLLKAIASLSSKEKKRQKASQQRSEPNQEVSEFHLSVITDTEQQVGLHDLIGSLQKSSEHGVLKKKLDSMQRNSGTLDVPLPKPEVQKIQRTIAYEETSKDVEKWALTVKKNREAEHLSFPLKPYQPPAPSLRSLAVNFKPRTPLEEEVAAILKGSSHMLERKDKELTEEEEQALLAMDLEEAKERRHELQKLRALQSYYEAKCHRMRKIKSKKYHRVKKKAEKRAAEKIFEGDLQNEDPELAKEALEKAERLRATERVSLKHKNTSKWAKQLIAKGGKNPDTKKLLQDQLLIGRTLTKKTAESDSDEEMETPVQQAGVADDEDKSDTYGNLLLSEDNPWKLDGKGKGNSQETTSSFDYDSSAKLHKLQPITARETGGKEEEESEPSDAGEAASEDEFELQPVELVKKKTKKLKRKGKVAEETKKKKKRKSELSADNDDNVAGKKAKKSEKTTKRKTKKSAKEDDETEGFQDTVEREQVDSAKRRGSKKASKKTVKFNSDDKIIGELENSVVEETGKTIVRTERHIGEDKNMSSTNSNVRKRRSIGDETTNTKSKEIRVDPKKIFRIEDRGPEMDDSASSSLQQKRIDIQQAFANDDVVEEFVQEKSEIEDAAKPKDIDLSLPGWGSWAGVGVKPSKSKKTVVTKKADPAPPRKDKGLSHVIISEEKSKWLVKNQVSSVPHPFNNHVQFERSVRNPVGKHWNTGSTVNQLTKPRVSTLIGTPIEPIKATKEIKRRKPGEGKQKGKQSPGITIHS